MADERLRVLPTPIDGLMRVARTPVADARGFLSRLYDRGVLAQAGLADIVQVNHTLTRARGTVRGMHFQRPPSAEDKLVSCIRGAVFDVAVDLRAGSPTLLGWHGERLDAGNGLALLIPKGFAHGFQALTDDCELLYLHSAVYDPAAEGALNATDPALAIDWPLPIAARSPRDQAHPPLTPDFEGIRLS